MISFSCLEAITIKNSFSMGNSKVRSLTLLSLKAFMANFFLQDVGPQDVSTYYNEICIAKVTQVIK